jgi:outer membrane protein TolC
VKKGDLIAQIDPRPFQARDRGAGGQAARGVAEYRQTVLAAFAGVEDNLAALRVLATESGQQEEAVAAAERALTLANTRYQGGITTYLEIITAQTAALANERAAVHLLGRRLTAARGTGARAG